MFGYFIFKKYNFKYFFFSVLNFFFLFRYDCFVRFGSDTQQTHSKLPSEHQNVCTRLQTDGQTDRRTNKSYAGTKLG